MLTRLFPMILGLFPKSTAETTSWDLWRRRVNSRGYLATSPVTSSFTIWSVSFDGVDGGNTLNNVNLFWVTIVLQLPWFLFLQLFRVSSLLLLFWFPLIQLRQKLVIPNKPRRPLPPKRHRWSLQTSHGGRWYLSLLLSSIKLKDKTQYLHLNIRACCKYMEWAEDREIWKIWLGKSHNKATESIFQVFYIF